MVPRTLELRGDKIQAMIYLLTTTCEGRHRLPVLLGLVRGVLPFDPRTVADFTLRTGRRVMMMTTTMMMLSFGISTQHSKYPLGTTAVSGGGCQTSPFLYRSAPVIPVVRAGFGPARLVMLELTGNQGVLGSPAGYVHSGRQ